MSSGGLRPVPPAATLGSLADATGPSQTGGSRTNGSDVTWSTELKFRSRFFHVYVIGRAWHVATAEPVGVRRLHAVYDSSTWIGDTLRALERSLALRRGPGLAIHPYVDTRKVSPEARWNLSSRGSVTDMTVP